MDSAATKKSQNPKPQIEVIDLDPDVLVDEPREHPTLAAVKEKMGTPKRGKTKLKTSNRSETKIKRPLKLKIFHLFTNLPPNLRLQIWKLALPGSRDIWIDRYGKPNSRHSPSPSILQVCLESRDFALRHYRRCIVPRPVFPNFHIQRQEDGPTKVFRYAIYVAVEPDFDKITIIRKGSGRSPSDCIWKVKDTVRKETGASDTFEWSLNFLNEERCGWWRRCTQRSKYLKLR